MSKEEKLTEQAEKIEQEATEHCNKVLCSVCEKVGCTKEIKCREWRDRRAGYYCGAEPKEERIAELIKENQDLRDNYELFKAIAEPEIERLKKENIDLFHKLELFDIYKQQNSLLSKKNLELDDELTVLEKENAELKEFYENEYFQISDRTADEKIKELEKHQVEVTIDDYSPYDPNTWGVMHEEWFVPKEEVRDLLKENYALITKAKEHIRTLISCLIDWVQEGDKDYCYIADAEQFLKENE